MIIKVDPPDTEQFNVVQVDSDAPDNMTAIREIDDWAEARGFVRTNEYWLRRILVDGKRRFRGICFRLMEEERAAARLDQEESDRRMRRMPTEILAGR